MELEPSLRRWIEARLIDAEQAERIRAFESAQAPARRARWPVIVALAFGGIMLAAGILLFVSAHWDELSPVRKDVAAGRGGRRLSRRRRFATRSFPRARHHAARRRHRGARRRDRVGGADLQHGGTLAHRGAAVGRGRDRRMALTARLAAARDRGPPDAVVVVGPNGSKRCMVSTGFRVVSVAVLMLAICYLSVPMPVLRWIGGIACCPPWPWSFLAGNTG